MSTFIFIFFYPIISIASIHLKGIETYDFDVEEISLPTRNYYLGYSFP